MTANCDDQHLPRLTLAQTEPSTHDTTIEGFSRELFCGEHPSKFVFPIGKICANMDSHADIARARTVASLNEGKEMLATISAPTYPKRSAENADIS